MSLKTFKSYTKSTRGTVLVDKKDLWKGKALKSLTYGKNSTGGRNNLGRITSRHKGAGHKNKYRVVDFHRRKDDIKAKIERIEYDPNRSAYLALVKYVCERTIVMYLGSVVEDGPTKEVISNPLHPYTKALVEAVPVPHVDQSHEPLPIIGNIPDATKFYEGCKFSDRCPNPSHDCKHGNIKMGLIEAKPGHWVDKCCINCK